MEASIEKVIDKFIDDIRHQKLLQDDRILKLPSGKIAGDEDKRRHVEGHDKPFERI